VGVVNLKWHDARGRICDYLRPDQWNSGWPDALRVGAIVVLQRPLKPGEKQGLWAMGRAANLVDAIEGACRSGDLPGMPIEGSFEVTASAFSAWLAAQREAPSEHIAAWVQAAESEHAVIAPPEGWTVISKYGTQLSQRHGKLVRLEDVFDWLHSGGMSAHDAVYKVFGPYYEACIEGEDCDLLILNAIENPSDLARDGKKSTMANVKFFASAFPDLGHVKFEDGSFGGLVYSMGEAALRVWRGNADVRTDHYARFNDRKEAATDAKYAIRWPSDDDLTKLLGRLAVPIKAAYRQWRYGRVVNVADDTTQTEAVSLVAVALTVEAIKAGAGKNKRGEWTEDALTLIRCAFIEAKRNGDRLADVAERFGLSRQAFSGAATREKKGTRSGAVQTLTVVTSAANRGATR
jgi:hypothetical protein